MPFKKIISGAKRGQYRSPSGRVFTPAQVRLYYSGGRNGFPARKSTGRRKK